MRFPAILLAISLALPRIAAPAQPPDTTVPSEQDALKAARTQLHQNQYDLAQSTLETLLNLHPRSAEAKFLLAYVLFREDRPRRSLELYTEAAALQTPTASDLKIVGLDYVLLNDLPDAIRWLEHSIADDPNDAEAHYHLGRAYYTQNLFDRAISSFERALELNPKYGKAQNNLGLAYAAQNKPDQAEAAYRKAIALDNEAGKPSEQPYMNLAELLIERDRVSEALTLLDTAKTIQPGSSHLQELRGRAFLNLGRLPEAESSFRSAIELSPKSGSLHYELGRVLRREGKAEDAQKEFDRSRNLLGARSSAPN